MRGRFFWFSDEDFFDSSLFSEEVFFSSFAINPSEESGKWIITQSRKLWRLAADDQSDESFSGSFSTIFKSKGFKCIDLWGVIAK